MENQTFLCIDKETGEFDIDDSKVYSYLRGYSRGYNIAMNISTLRNLGLLKEGALKRNRYNEEYEKKLFDSFKESIHREAAVSYDILDDETLNRYLEVAKEYIKNVGRVSVDAVINPSIPNIILLNKS